MRDKIVTELFRYETQTLIGKIGGGTPAGGARGGAPPEGWGGRPRMTFDL